MCHPVEIVAAEMSCNPVDLENLGYMAIVPKGNPSGSVNILVPKGDPSNLSPLFEF